MGKIIGIDLGTTTSEIAYMKDGKPVIIRNEKYGEGAVIPSVVTIKEKEIIVGKKAKRQLLLRPESTVSEIKRLMGSKEKIKINGEEYMPEQISAMILRNLLEVAREELGEISEAVITVPANFDDIQRTATKNAANIAGIKVERIINEPTAAALSYGLENLKEEANILVYDLGGGTFDCTILEMFSGIMDVRASRGDNALGGKDFDKKIEEYILEHIEKDYEIDTKSLDIKKLSEIKDAAERAKKDLSLESSTEILINNFHIDKEGNSVDIELELSRKEFEKRAYDLIKRTEDIVDETLKASKISPKDIDVVLAIGGSSRMDMVRRLLKDKFGEEKIKKGINPDEAVALGAAVQAGIKTQEIRAEEGIIITDACSHTLGVEVLGEKFSPIIFRDTKIPCENSENYVTVEDWQTVILIKVYQGESEDVHENTLIGQFRLTEIPSAKRGVENVEVKFKYNLNGMLDVSAKISSTGKEEKRVMALNTLSKGQLQAIAESTFKDVEYEEVYKKKGEGEKIDSKGQGEDFKNSRLYGIVEVSLSLAEKKRDELKGEDREKVEKILYKIREALLKEDKEALEKLDYELTDLLFEL